MHESKTFVDKRGNVHPLNGLFGYTRIKTVENGEVTIDNEETFCTGQDTFINGVLRKNIVSQVEYVIELGETTARWENGGNHGEDISNSDIIPCKLAAEGCISYENMISYFWKDDQQSCPLVVTKRAIGEKVKGDHFLSREGGIYLEMNKQEVYPGCQFSVHGTNIPGVYLLESSKAVKHGHELKEFRADDFSEVKFAISRDLFGIIIQEEKIEQQNRAHLKSTCHQIQNVKERGITLSEKGSSNIINTETPGTFLMVEGELYGQIICPIVDVSPRKTTICSYEFPVTHNGENMWLEPLTRILRTSYTLTPCSQIGAPKFKTNSGRYIQASPEISFIKSPKQLKYSFEDNDFQEDDDEVQFGLYTQPETEQYEHSIHFKASKHELQSKMATHWLCAQNSEDCDIAFPQLDYSTLDLMAPRDTLTKILDGVLHFGGPSSMVISAFNYLYEGIMKIAFFIWACIKIWKRCFRQQRNQEDDEQRRRDNQVAIQVLTQAIQKDNENEDRPYQHLQANLTEID